MTITQRLFVMKKLLTTILFISYFIASSGATIHVHYCMGKAVEIGLSKKAGDEKCPGCGMKDKKGCCNDKETTIKIAGNYQHVVTDYVSSSPTFCISHLLFNELLVIYPKENNVNFYLIDSSPQKNPSLNIFHCLFLI